MFSLQFAKLILKLVMPGVQDADLETESRACDNEVCQGESAGDEHVDYVTHSVRVHTDIVGDMVH